MTCYIDLGHGHFCAQEGTAGGIPAIFIRKAREKGKVGELVFGSDVDDPTPNDVVITHPDQKVIDVIINAMWGRYVAS